MVPLPDQSTAPYRNWRTHIHTRPLTTPEPNQPVTFAKPASTPPKRASPTPTQSAKVWGGVRVRACWCAQTPNTEPFLPRDVCVPLPDHYAIAPFSANGNTLCRCNRFDPSPLNTHTHARAHTQPQRAPPLRAEPAPSRATPSPTRTQRQGSRANQAAITPWVW